MGSVHVDQLGRVNDRREGLGSRCSWRGVEDRTIRYLTLELELPGQGNGAVTDMRRSVPACGATLLEGLLQDAGDADRGLAVQMARKGCHWGAGRRHGETELLFDTVPTDHWKAIPRSSSSRVSTSGKCLRQAAHAVDCPLGDSLIFTWLTCGRANRRASGARGVPSIELIAVSTCPTSSWSLLARRLQRRCAGRDELLRELTAAFGERRELCKQALRRRQKSVELRRADDDEGRGKERVHSALDLGDRRPGFAAPSAPLGLSSSMEERREPRALSAGLLGLQRQRNCCCETLSLPSAASVNVCGSHPTPELRER